MSTQTEKEHYTQQDYQDARIRGSYENAAYIARWLANQFKPFDAG